MENTMKKKICCRFAIPSISSCQNKTACRTRVTLTFDLDLGPTLTNASNGTSTHEGEQLYKFILKSIQSCEIMVWTEISPLSVTLALHLPERLIQMAHLHVIKNNCVKSF